MGDKEGNAPPLDGGKGLCGRGRGGLAGLERGDGHSHVRVKVRVRGVSGARGSLVCAPVPDGFRVQCGVSIVCSAHAV